MIGVVASLPVGWRWASLDEFSTSTPGAFVDGPFGSELKVSDLVKEGVPLVRIQHIGVGSFRPGFDQFVSEKKFVELKRHDVLPGDLVFAKLGDPPGRSALIPSNVPRGLIVADCVRLRIDPKKVEPRFLGWAVNAPMVLRQIGSASKGATRQRANLSDFRKLRIPVPKNRDKQKRIAGLIEQADRLRRTSRYALELSDTFLAAAFLKFFGDPKENPENWPRRHLSDVCVRFADGPFGSNLKSEHYRSSGVRVIRLNNIGVGEFLDNNKAFISTEHFQTLRRHECLPDDVLIGTLGDPNLRACIQPSTIVLAVNKADCVQARPDPKKANAAYLCALLNLPSTLYLIPGMVHGQTRGRVSMGEIAELPIPVPPLSGQTHFAELVRQHELLRANQLEVLRQAEHLFEYLLHRAFAVDL